MKPRNTLASVIAELADGLSDGSIVLGSETPTEIYRDGGRTSRFGDLVRALAMRLGGSRS